MTVYILLIGTNFILHTILVNIYAKASIRQVREYESCTHTILINIYTIASTIDSRENLIHTHLIKYNIHTVTSFFMVLHLLVPSKRK